MQINDTIAKITPNDLDKLFQSKFFYNFNISEKVSDGATCEMTLSTSRFSNIVVL